MGSLNDLVHVVNGTLKERDINVPFFVAGGSVYSSIRNSDRYSDIDVQFYNEDDYNQVATEFHNNFLFETPNAITVKSKDHSSIKDIQFIKLHFGTPKEIFETFDFNVSKCAIDSEYNEHYGDDFDKIKISVNLDRISPSTLRRLFKYTNNKGAKDDDYIVLKSIYNHLLDHRDEELEINYEEIKGIKPLDVINDYLNNIDDDDWIVHNIIEDKFKPDDRVAIFEQIKHFWYSEISGCDELTLFQIINNWNGFLHKHSGFYIREKILRIKSKYPEYFIQEII